VLPLPIDPLLASITELVRDNAQVILTATPGAGKTTRLPPELLKAVKGKIAVLEPRRMATVAACSRVCEERGWQVGREAGYQVRFESKLTADTRLIFMTDALLLRRLVDDPELKEFDLIVLDEFHERGLNQDVILGTLKELQELGRDIKILVMSATLDVGHLQEYLPASCHIDVPGKVFPLEVRNSSQPMKLQTDRDFFDRVLDAALVSSRETSGDILIFLPGQGEIARLQESLEIKNTGRDVVPLHGSLSLQDQKNVLREHDRPRFVLATNIAEASVTVPGVDRVIDTGLAKIMEVNLQSGFSRLELTRIAQFNARQRAGRAARQKPGVCIRLWTTHEEVTQAQEMVPECQRVDLASTFLLLAHLGVSDFENFAWFDKPPLPLIKMASENLRDLGAFDTENRLTAIGKNLLRYPLPPRLGGLLTTAETVGGKRLAARAAALLQDRDILARTTEIHSHLECDVTYRLSLLDEVEKGRTPAGVNRRAADGVLEAAAQLERLMPTKTPSAAGDDTLRKLLLLSQSDRLARRRKGTERAVMMGGRGLKIAKESQVRESEFFVCLQGIDFPNQPDTTVSMACGFTKQFVLDVLKDRIETVEDVVFDELKGEFFARRVRRFKDLDLDEPSLSRLDPKSLGDRFAQVVTSQWSSIAKQNEALKHWLERWNFFVSQAPEMAEHLTPALTKQVAEMAAFGKTQIKQVIEQDLVALLESVMDKQALRQFHKEVPARFQAPSGFGHAIHYQDTEPPFVEVRLQEMFGLIATPKLVFGKIPLTFKLLGPNYRPVQVTSDIEGFWQRAYVEVRKELRGRYPKHSWPEDPLTAVPVAKGSRRR